MKKKTVLFKVCVCIVLMISILYASDKKMKEVKAKEEYSDSLLYSRIGPIWQFADENNIKIYKFKERKKLCNFIKKNNVDKLSTDTVFLKKSEKIHLDRENSPYYKKTLEQSELLYYGKLNSDSEPDGLGIILELYTDLNTDDPDLMIRYMGYFKNGQYDGYGVEFAIPSAYEIPVSMEGIKNNITLFNEPIYEGKFKKGEYCGKGNSYSNDLLSIVLESSEEVDPAILSYNIIVAKYKKGSENGKAKEYYGNKLRYSGEMKKGEYDGKGKLYSVDTGKIIYEGEFDGGVYWGKGILYDENGELIHKGEFMDGDVK